MTYELQEATFNNYQLQMCCMSASFKIVPQPLFISKKFSFWLSYKSFMQKYAFNTMTEKIKL